MKRRAAFDYNNCDIEIAAAEGAIDILNCQWPFALFLDTFCFQFLLVYMPCKNFIKILFSY